jgi:hypothetical protein
MPAHVQPTLYSFHVVLERDGREVDAVTAPTGERALKNALLMLAKLDQLKHGDRLTCTETR